MQLSKARVQMYRGVRDTGWFELDSDKTILVGPNEAGKTAVLRALQQLNAPPGTPGFEALRDYPRAKLNDIDTGKVKPESVVVAEGVFTLDETDKAAVAAIAPEFADCVLVVERRLNNTSSMRLQNCPSAPKYGDIEKDLDRLTSHVAGRVDASANPPPPAPRDLLKEIVSTWTRDTPLTGDSAERLATWLKTIALPLVDEKNKAEEERYDRLLGAATLHATRQRVFTAVTTRLPVFVYYNNYFRVRPRVHLSHLASRIESKVLDDEEYDFGNQCLLKLLGFTARELSNLGSTAEPKQNDADALKKYRDQLDTRDYRLNAASVRLTQEIRKAWQPDAKTGEAATLRVKADQQYLKVVVEDDLGVEVELDQRSEGFQWLVSFFVVFFAEAVDSHKNAILLLDEPGMSLHGLKQREFRTTVSRLAADNQLLFTTHSPFLVGPDELAKVRVVEMAGRETGTKVHTTITAESPAALLPLQEALGYDLAQSLFAQQRNLVLEGITDYWYVEATARLLRDSGETDLNDKIALVFANGAGKVVYYATILHAHSLKVAALLDSDAAGEQAARQETLVHTLGNKCILRTRDAYTGESTQPEIEDLLRSTLIAVAKSDLGWDVSALASAQPTRPILHLFAEEVGKDFSKYRLAKAYLRWTSAHKAADLQPEERKNWASLIDAINKALK